MSGRLRDVVLVGVGVSFGLMLVLGPTERAMVIRLCLLGMFWCGFVLCYWALREDGKR